MATPLRLIVLCIAFLVRRFFQPDDFSLLRVSQPGRDLLFLNNSQGYGMRLWASPCGPRRHERRRQAVSALRVSAADAKGPLAAGNAGAALTARRQGDER